MKPRPTLVAATLLLTFVIVQAEEDLVTALESRVQKCAEAVTPSLVAIEATPSAPMPRPASGLESILGNPALPKFASGVLVSDQGHIITLANCIAMTDKINIRLSDGRRLQAKLEACDCYSKLALLKVEEEGLPAVKWGDSDQVKLGNFVLAAGNPYGLRGSVSLGIVSGLKRRVEGYTGTLLQTTAPINPGDAGGVLANLNGEMIGLIRSSLAGARPCTPAQQAPGAPAGFNNYRFPGLPGANLSLPGQPLPQAISFAIPSNIVRRVADELIRKGRVDWGHLGLTIRATGEKPQPGGIKVERTAPGSPAEEAGVRKGDLITSFTSSRNVLTSFSGHPEDCKKLQELVLNEKVGRDITLLILREDKELEVKVRVGLLPSNALLRARPAAYPGGTK